MPPNRNCWSVKLATMCENRCEFTKHEWTPRTVCSVKYSVPKTSVRVRKWLRDTESKMGEGVWKLKENGDWAWRIKSLGNGWLLGNVNILLQSCAIGYGYNFVMHVLPHESVNSWRYSHTKQSHFLLHCIGKLGTGKNFHEYLSKIHPRIQ